MAVTGHHARLGTRLRARLCRGPHFRRLNSMSFQGTTRADPYERSLAHTALISDGGGEAYHCLPHTRQPRGHACPALCRVHVRSMSVLLDQRPSLLTLRVRFPVFVRMIHRYYAAVRLLDDVHAGRTALAFSRRPADYLCQIGRAHV